MTRWYVDTSAALKLIVDEVESAALVAAIADAQPQLVGTLLLETELRRAAAREAALTQTHVTGLLTTIDLFELPPSLYREAGLLAGESLRSLDALHLAAAVRLGVDAVLTYDQRMADAAHELGIPVTAPR